MENIELKKEQLLRLLFEGNVIGMGTNGIIKQFDPTTLVNTYLSKDPNVLDNEIETSKEIQKTILAECRQLFDPSETEKLEQKKLQYLYEIGLVKGIIFYKEYKIGVLLNDYYKEYSELAQIKRNLDFKSLLFVMEIIEGKLEEIMKNGIFPGDLKEDNILVRPYNLDIKFIDLDDSRARYEDIDYILTHSYIKNDCLEAYEKMKKRILYKK